MLEIERIVVRVTRAGGCTHAQALVFAETISAEIRRELGGDNHYIPVPTRSDRDARILADDRPADQVARRNGVHPSTVRRIRRRKRDPQQFGSEEWGSEF